MISKTLPEWTVYRDSHSGELAAFSRSKPDEQMYCGQTRFFRLAIVRAVNAARAVKHVQSDLADVLSVSWLGNCDAQNEQAAAKKQAKPARVIDFSAELLFATT